MCGIAGYVRASEGESLDLAKIGEVLGSIRHRGPDQNGYFSDPRAFLGHTRLSILDLATGLQPMYNEDRSKCIVFNGEIFNFREVRDLLRGNHRFSTNSDTEVIMHAYEEWGENCLERFRGMFAFAIYDLKRKTLFAARDRLGIKPFFYRLQGDTFYFASEMKAIFEMSPVARVIDSDALVSYFTLSYVPAPMTIFKEVRKLLPGHYLTVERGRMTISKYWDIRFAPDRSKSERYFVEGVRSLLHESVGMRMTSDVPIGAFLSGGIDSSVVVSIMSGLADEPVSTFCMGYGGDIGGFLDERGYARLVAEMYRTSHREHEVFPCAGAILDDIVRSFDEPFADSSTIPSYYLCKITREKVKVALSGLGGDELFGGYERYLGLKLGSYYMRLPLFLRRELAALAGCIPERKDGHYTVNHLKRFARGSCREIDHCYYDFLSILKGRGELFSDPASYQRGNERCRDLILGYFRSDNGEEVMDKVVYTDLKSYVPDDILACTDRISMWHNLEVRVPFLDHRVLEFCATIPFELKIRFLQKKYLLRKAYRDAVPKAIMAHRKQGFIGPMAIWLHNDLKPMVAEMLCAERLERHGLFDPKVVQRIIHEHESRQEMHEKLIWALLVFQRWYEKYCC